MSILFLWWYFVICSMASKESSRSAPFLALLKQRRDAPPKVWHIPASELASVKVSSGELLARLRLVDQTKCYFPHLLNTFAVCAKTTLAVDSVRFNRWGKFELRFVDLVSNFKALKASPEEVEALSWVQFNTEDEEIKNFLAVCVSKTVDHNGKMPAPGFAVRLLDISFGKNTGLGAEKRDPVFAKTQVVVFPEEQHSSKEKASSSSSSTDPPPAKKSRKSPKEKADRPKTPESSSSSSPGAAPIRDDDIPPEDPDAICS